MWILHALMFYVVGVVSGPPDGQVSTRRHRALRLSPLVRGRSRPVLGALQLFFTERPVDSRPGRQTLAVTAAILLIIGAFAPIVSFPFVGDIDFFREGYGDGYILLIMAGLSAALAVTGRWKQVLVPAWAVWP